MFRKSENVHYYFETEERKLKKALKGYLAGFLSAAVLVSGVTYAANTTTLYDVIANGIKIVIDGRQLNPTDANGNKVEPIIYNGTTYLPVRAVANAFGKAVYWDGPNYTVYLGDMGGELEYPTVKIEDMVSIADKPRASDQLTDNYGNNYAHAICNRYDHNLEFLCNMKYSRFKGTLYVPAGETDDRTVRLSIIADGKTLYTSPEMDKTSAPVNIDADITGYNDVKIEFSGGITLAYSNWLTVCLGNAGFYQ